MKTVFTLWLAMSALLAAGLEFPETLKEIHAPMDATKVTADFSFTNRGDKPVTILKYQAACTSCMGLRIKDKKLRYEPGESGLLEADFEMGNFSGTIDKTVAVWLEGDPESDPSVKLTVRVHIPVLVAVEPKTLNWKLGDQAKPQTIRITMADARPTRVTNITCSSQSFKSDLKTVEEGKVYELIVTPAEMGTPALGIIRIETDSRSEKQRLQQAFVVVRKPRPGETAAKP
jgi:hypothetical protein